MKLNRKIVLVVVIVVALALIAAVALDPGLAKSAADSITPEKIKELADLARQ